MSFFTSLTYYRPGTPPMITGSDLGEFIAQVYKTGLISDSGFRWLKVKFGKAIDQDNEPSMQEQVSPGELPEMVDIDWDIEFDPPHTKNGKNSSDELIEHLANEKRHIYRASVAFGCPVENVLSPITRQNSPENEHDFTPDGLTLHVDQVFIGLLSTEEPVRVGWIELSFAGYGYLYPWTFRDLVKRADGSREIAVLTKLCREVWPVPKQEPSAHLIVSRNKIKHLLPFDDLNTPPNWFWGVRET